ncbi:MAG: tRNA pseudouridine(38-40) synthase TruA [Candidatus Eisenbacteria bacterium]|uniref:tRNA pseudouridine synthase A n=1 Tax=Eiseniibacteriota bacterium TaxID=2212470 RepID=A0A849SRM5_UNCEI|nr:tRNA pseudouridine(38-40) synthase TruA [Candidatus Eisenbacteria bacterium]
MRTFRLDVAYDGTAFHGWQRQPGLRTVQGELERQLSEVLEEDVKTVGAGRTDTGVHAHGQVASFQSATRLPARALPHRLERGLGDDVRVTAASEAMSDFDARRSARARRYRYRLLDAEDVLWGRFAWCPRQRFDGAALADATRGLEGEHDFSAFRASGGAPTSPRCHMLSIGWERWEAGWRLELAADHFLYHMVRNIVGTALAASRTSDPHAAMRAVLESRERSRGGETAPPQGLSLEEVRYA